MLGSENQIFMVMKLSLTGIIRSIRYRYRNRISQTKLAFWIHTPQNPSNTLDNIDASDLSSEIVPNEGPSGTCPCRRFSTVSRETAFDDSGICSWTYTSRMFRSRRLPMAQGTAMDQPIAASTRLTGGVGSAQIRQFKRRTATFAKKYKTLSRMSIFKRVFFDPSAYNAYAL